MMVGAGKVQDEGEGDERRPLGKSAGGMRETAVCHVPHFRKVKAARVQESPTVKIQQGRRLGVFREAV